MRRVFSGALSRQLRLDTGLRTEVVAIHIGRSWYSVAEYERGRVTPSTPVLVALADLYGCAIDAFFEEARDAAA
jgi:transcriptional regulator with XRE-family HTH domain